MIKRNNNERVQTLELVNQLREELQRQAGTIGGLRSDLHARTDALQQLLEDKDSRSEEIRMLKVGASCRAALCARLLVCGSSLCRWRLSSQRAAVSLWGCCCCSCGQPPAAVHWWLHARFLDPPESSELLNTSQSQPTP